MQIKEKTKPEVEAKSSGMSDFLKMEYLEECLKNNLSFDIKKFCALELVKLYEARKMFSEAGRKLIHASEISLTFRDKKNLYMKAAELFIKAELYDLAEHSLRKAQEQGTKSDISEMKKAIKQLLLQQAGQYEKEIRKGKALKAYEYLYKISNEQEKEKIKEKLLMLYEKLGKVSEYNILKGH